MNILFTTQSTFGYNTFDFDKAEEISRKLTYIKEHLNDLIKVTIIYFKKDNRKDGGEYLSIEGIVSRIDEYHKWLKIGDTQIKFTDIYDIDSDIFLYEFI